MYRKRSYTEILQDDEIYDSHKSNIPFPLLVLAKNLQLGKANKEKNFVFSPTSIQLALSLVANGSTGSTLNEFLTFLEAKDLNHLNSVAVELIEMLTDTTEGGPTMSFVGGVWVDQSLALKPTFQATAESIYRANAKSEINEWAAEATNGLIKSILPPDTKAMAVLANAIYFKGTWKEKFEKKRTKEFPFYLADGTSSVAVPFMTSWKDQYISTFDDFKVLTLPYQKGIISSKSSLSMHIILPNQVNGIWRLIERVGSDPSFFKTHVRCRKKVRVGQFRIPKFKMEHGFEASEDLKNINLKLPFEDEAEFGEMVEGQRLQIDKVHHKAYIEVNEEGTEAAAVTAMSMIEGCCAFVSPPTPVDFVADHPFMFVARDYKNGMILFMGHVINPSL
ncbi:hypothetical protein ACHQM5_019945 [Ranunculus cassubicifolius]